MNYEQKSASPAIEKQTTEFDVIDKRFEDAVSTNQAIISRIYEKVANLKHFNPQPQSACTPESNGKSVVDNSVTAVVNQKIDRLFSNNATLREIADHLEGIV